MAMALRPLAGIVANPGADNITRMLDVPHSGQLHGKALSAMGRRALKSPQQGQSYSYMGMVFPHLYLIWEQACSLLSEQA